MVEMTFDFVGSAASVGYVVRAANAPAPPPPGEYWNAPLQANGHYENDEYLTAGGHYRFYVRVVGTNGITYAQVLDFWAV
jgi:hypothetical protein